MTLDAAAGVLHFRQYKVSKPYQYPLKAKLVAIDDT